MEDWTYVAEINHRLAPRTTEDVEESQRDNVDSFVLAIKSQVLLCAMTVLAPVTVEGDDETYENVQVDDTYMASCRPWSENLALMIRELTHVVLFPYVKRHRAT